MKDFISKPASHSSHRSQTYATYSTSSKNKEAVAQRKNKDTGLSAFQVAQLKLKEEGKDIPMDKDPISRFHALKAADGKQANSDAPVQRKNNSTEENNTTGLPGQLKSGIENLSGYSMDDVKVNYNSSKPAQLQAHAYAQGTEIHLGPGQEKHLPHEAWHVVQQKQGIVKPTLQMKKEVSINDDAELEKEADVMGAKAIQSTDSGNNGNEQNKIRGNANVTTTQPTFQLVKQTTDGWYTEDDFGPFESAELAKYAEDNPKEREEVKAKPALAKFIIRWSDFDREKIPLLEKGSFHDKGREKGIVFEGGNNGMWVEHKEEKKDYFVKGYSLENMSEDHEEIDRKKIEEQKRKEEEQLLSKSDDEKPSISLVEEIIDEDILTTLFKQPELEQKDKKIIEDDIDEHTLSSLFEQESSENDNKPSKDPTQFEKKLKQAMKNKKAIYEYIAIRAYHEAGLKPPFDSHLFQDEQKRVFVANDWAQGVGSVLPDEREKKDNTTETEGTDKKENEFDRWNRAKPYVQESRAFKEGLVLDLVLGMHDLLNADNWKHVGGEDGEVVPFDFGGPFDVRATAQTLNDDGKQGKEGWEQPKNVNLIGRWLNLCTLSMLNYGDSTDKLKKKSVYSNVSDETLLTSAKFMSGKWDGLIAYIEKELLAKGVHEEDVKELISVLKVRAKSMQYIADRKLSRGQYISWDPEESLSGKFKGLSPDPEGRKERLKSSEKSGPLVATASAEKVDGGGMLHTELIETEFHGGQICVRVYQTSFAPLTEKTLTGKFKDVYQDPEDKKVKIEPNRKENGGVAATCYGIGRPLRALKWVEKYLTQNGVNVDAQPVVRTFLIPHRAYMALLDKTIQHESDYENKHGMSQNVDSGSAPDQYELTESHIIKLQQQALPNTLQTYTINDVNELPKSSKIDHGTAHPMRALYDKVGVPVFADTLSNEYHPWLNDEDHLNQKGGSAKSKSLHRLSDAYDVLKSNEWIPMDPRGLNLEESKDGEVPKEGKIFIDLKSFLLLHLGRDSRYLKGIQREMIHRGVHENEIDYPLTLSELPYITSNDRDKLLSNNNVKFFMEEIFGAAMTQIEILSQHGDWTKALKEEKKPSSKESGFEVYSYVPKETSPFDFGERKVEHFSPSETQKSIRKTMLDAYTPLQPHDFDSRKENKRPENTLTAIQNSDLFREDISDDIKTLILNLASSRKIYDLHNLAPEFGGISKEDLMDLFINIGIYGDAWMTGGKMKDDDVELTSGRRSEGTAEYLTSDLKDFCKTRAKKESKPENIVRRELNAEIKAIPRLETYKDKDIRISPQNSNINKHRGDITPLTTMARALSEIPEGVEGNHRKSFELDALKGALKMIQSILTNQTLQHSKSQSEDKEIYLWKTFCKKMTSTWEGHLSEARNTLFATMEKVTSLEELKEQIKVVEEELNKIDDDVPINSLWGSDD